MAISTSRCPNCPEGYLEWCVVENGKVRGDLPFLKEATCPKCGKTTKIEDAPQI
jgi:hypothetical protein